MIKPSTDIIDVLYYNVFAYHRICCVTTDCVARMADDKALT